MLLLLFVLRAEVEAQVWPLREDLVKKSAKNVAGRLTPIIFVVTEEIGQGRPVL